MGDSVSAEVDRCREEVARLGSMQMNAVSSEALEEQPEVLVVRLEVGRCVSPFRECWEMLVPKFTPFPVHILNKYLTFERIQIPRLFLGV